MIAALLLQVAEAPSGPPPLPSDWSALPTLPYVAPRQATPQVTAFVSREIAAGRCVAQRPADGHYVLPVEVATLVGVDGSVRRVVPHAIACPTIEQYAAGLVSGFARGNVAQFKPAADTWYRTTIVFDWHG
ncbi:MULTISPECIES: hypothetical protein [Sphingomonas]|jgi:hypothetical protein|uniref:hypothetical protein n=1 Tax=Sphingomonas TaxID=13687 RepID=UPI00241310F6|nr:hypothetical protein [Sphingomonas echinoides]